jgi:hypothetical protein
MLSGHYSPGPGCAKLAPSPFNNQLCRVGEIFWPSGFSFYKGCILLFEDSCGALCQYLFFSFNIFRITETLPVKYSLEMQPWSGQEIF